MNENDTPHCFNIIVNCLVISSLLYPTNETVTSGFTRILRRLRIRVPTSRVHA